MVAMLPLSGTRFGDEYDPRYSVSDASGRDGGFGYGVCEAVADSQEQLHSVAKFSERWRFKSRPRAREPPGLEVGAHPPYPQPSTSSRPPPKLPSEPLFSGIETDFDPFLDRAIAQEQRRSAYMRQQLETQRELGRDSADIDQLTKMLAAQDARIAELKKQVEQK